VLDDLAKKTGMKVNGFFASDYAGIIEGMRFNKVHVAWYGRGCLGGLAAHSAPKCEYQQRRAHSGHFNNSPTPDRCAGRTEDQKTLARHPIEPVVVAAERPALYRALL
jgi:hypothetical protein